MSRIVKYILSVNYVPQIVRVARISDIKTIGNTYVYFENIKSTQKLKFSMRTAWQPLVQIRVIFFF